MVTRGDQCKLSKGMSVGAKEQSWESVNSGAHTVSPGQWAVQWGMCKEELTSVPERCHVLSCPEVCAHAVPSAWCALPHPAFLGHLVLLTLSL